MPLMCSRHTDPSLHGLGNRLVLIRPPSSSDPWSLLSQQLDRNKCANVFVQPLGKQCKCLRSKIDFQGKKSMPVQFLNDPVPAVLPGEVTAGSSLASRHNQATICRVLLDLGSQRSPWGTQISADELLSCLHRRSAHQSCITYLEKGKNLFSKSERAENGEKCVLCYCN